MIYILRDEAGTAVMCGELDELRSIAPDCVPEATDMKRSEYEGSL